MLPPSMLQYSRGQHRLHQPELQTASLTAARLMPAAHHHCPSFPTESAGDLPQEATGSHPKHCLFLLHQVLLGPLEEETFHNTMSTGAAGTEQHPPMHTHDSRGVLKKTGRNHREKWCDPKRLTMIWVHWMLLCQFGNSLARTVCIHLRFTEPLCNKLS